MNHRRGLGLVFGILLLGLAFAFQGVLKKATLSRADLVIGNGAEIESLDPAQASSLPAGRVLRCLFEGLTTPDPRSLAPRPGMAESWKVAREGRRYRFHLRPKLFWSDGVPITAQDLRWSYLRFLDPRTASPYANLIQDIRGARRFSKSRHPTSAKRAAVGIEAPDGRTLVFTLEEPLPWFLDLMGFFPLFPVPRHVVEKEGAGWVQKRPFVSNGPFRLVFRHLSDRIRVERNPRFHGAAQVSLKTVDLLAQTSKTTLLNLYMGNEVDWITDVPSSAVPTLLKHFTASSGGEFRPAAYLGTAFLRINTRRPPFTNKKIREALSLAVDRQALVRHVTRCGELPASSLVPPGLPGYRPPRVARFDPTRARRLFLEGLSELHLKQAPPVEYLYNTRDLHRHIAELLQQHWARILGLHCRLRNMEWGAFKAACARGDYQLARASWYGDYADPETFLACFLGRSPNNQTGFQDPLYDRLLLKEAPAQTSSSQRMLLLAQGEKRLLESHAILPLYHDVTRNLVKPWVKGFFANILDLHPVGALSIHGR